MTVQRPHSSDTRKHRRPAALRNGKKRFDRGLPFFGIVFCLGPFSDVKRGVAERDQLLAIGQRDSFVEPRCPAHSHRFSSLDGVRQHDTRLSERGHSMSRPIRISSCAKLNARFGMTV
jgi:hypothetical protein